MVMRKMLKLLTTTKARKVDLLPIPTPGEILLEEFLKPSGMSQNALARAIGVPPRRINEIVLGKRAITADTDLRLARYYRISEGIFMGLQADYELRKQRPALGDKLKAIKPRAAYIPVAVVQWAEFAFRMSQNTSPRRFSWQARRCSCPTDLLIRIAFRHAQFALSVPQTIVKRRIPRRCSELGRA